MSLQGTLDTFALTELVRMLASTSKTGELTIEGDRGLGRLWFVDGALVAGEPTRTGSVTDALFELLRFEDGSFTFDAEVAAPEAGAPVDAGEALAAAESDLEAWRPVEALVPSSDTVVTLRGEIEGEHVTIDQATWRHLVAIGSGTTAGGFGALAGFDDIDSAVRIKELHDAGLVTVDPDAPPPATGPDPVDVAPEPHDEQGHPDVTLAAVDDLPEIARDLDEVDAFAAAGDVVALDVAPAPEAVEAQPEAFERQPQVVEPEPQPEPVEATWHDELVEDLPSEAPAEPEVAVDVVGEDAPPPAAEPSFDSDLAAVDLGSSSSGSTAVDLDSFGSTAPGHSYLGTGTGDEVLPEPLLIDAVPKAPTAEVDDLFGADDGGDSGWPGPAMDENDLAAQLGALSPAAARAVQAASNGQAPAEDESRGVVRRIISSNRP